MKKLWMFAKITTYTFFGLSTILGLLYLCVATGFYFGGGIGIVLGTILSTSVLVGIGFVTTFKE